MRVQDLYAVEKRKLTKALIDALNQLDEAAVACGEGPHAKHHIAERIRDTVLEIRTRFPHPIRL